MKARVDDATRAAIKSAVRLAAQMVGGAKYLCAETGLSPAQMSRLMAPHEPDLPILETAILIDRAVNQPLVTQAAFDTVLPYQPQPLMMDDAANLASLSGDVIGQLLDILHDGRVSPAEARDLSMALGRMKQKITAAKRAADHLAAVTP